MSFVRRRLRFTFSYGTGPDSLGTPTVVTIEDLRATARVVAAGGLSQGELQLRIYGMTLSMMNALSTLGTKITLVRRNTVIVEAGDDETGLAKIYQGTIYSAWADMNSAPDVAFNVIAHAAMFQNVATVNADGSKTLPSSFPGSVDAADVMADLAKKMDFDFENHGASVMLPPGTCFPGTLWTQAQDCRATANIEMVADSGVLAIWPKDGNRGGETALISPETGMRGYPTYTANGLIVTSLFDKRFRFGGLVEVQSSLQVAKGPWKITTLTHDLACEMPGGPWFTEMQLTPAGLLVVPR